MYKCIVFGIDEDGRANCVRYNVHTSEDFSISSSFKRMESEIIDDCIENGVLVDSFVAIFDCVETSSNNLYIERIFQNDIWNKGDVNDFYIE